MLCGVQVSEAYNYDGNNRLTTTTRGGQITSSREYDAAGQAWRTTSYSSPGVISERRDTLYNSNGWVTQQDVFNGAGTLQQRTSYTGYDGVGNATSYQVATFTGPVPFTNFYSYQYAKFDGYEEQVVNGSSTWFHDDEWLDFNMRQNGHVTEFTGRYDQTALDYERQPVKPVLDCEPIYEDHPVAFDAKKFGHSIAADVRRPAGLRAAAGAGVVSLRAKAPCGNGRADRA